MRWSLSLCTLRRCSTTAHTCCTVSHRILWDQPGNMHAWLSNNQCTACKRINFQGHYKDCHARTVHSVTVSTELHALWMVQALEAFNMAAPETILDWVNILFVYVCDLLHSTPAAKDTYWISKHSSVRLLVNLAFHRGVVAYEVSPRGFTLNLQSEGICRVWHVTVGENGWVNATDAAENDIDLPQRNAANTETPYEAIAPVFARYQYNNTAVIRLLIMHYFDSFRLKYSLLGPKKASHV